MTGAPLRPYRGLAPFDDHPADALLFFGREREREVIVANLLAARLTVLYGPSGVGKTSLLRAGVAQELRLLEDSNVATFASWTDDPTEEIDELVSSSDHTYLILDQFEEYFLYRESNAGFSARLPELVTDPTLRVNVLVGIREDELARLDSFKGRIANPLTNYLRLDHLDRDAARAAVLGPLRRLSELDPGGAPYRAEPELVEAVLDQVASGRIEYGLGGRGAVDGPGEHRVEAPFLQLVLERLWDVERERGSHVLRLETLEQLGGAETIVSRHLERALEQLDLSEQTLAAEMFAHLVTPSGTKIAHNPRDLARYAGAGERDVDDVLRRLALERIVRPVETGSQEPRYEIFHDVLASGVLAWRNAYESERAVELERRRRHRAVAIAATALLALAAVAAIALFALAQRERAQERATAARAREQAARSLTLLDVDPQQSLRLALAAAREEGTPQVETVLRTALLASRQRRVYPADEDAEVAAFDRSGNVLVPHGDTLRSYPAGGGEPTRVVGLNGRLLDLSDDRRLALVARGSELDVRRLEDGATVRTIRVAGPVLEARLDRRARRVALISPDRSGREYASVYRLEDGVRTHLFRRRGTKSVSFSPDGRLLATGSADDSARVWRLADGRAIRTFEEHSGDVLAVEFSPDGTLLATASADSGVRIWRLSDGERRFLFVGHNNPTVALAWSPDGRFVADASLDRTSRILDVGGIGAGRLAGTLIGHEEGVSAIAYSDDGRRLVTVALDGTARVWDARAEHELREVARHPAGPTGAVFHPDGRRVLSWGLDGATITEPGSSRRIASGPVTEAVFDARGERVATIGPGGALVHGRVARLRHRLPPVDVEFAPDGRVVTASPDGWARIFGRDGRLVDHLDHGEPVTRVATGAGAVATATRSGVVRIWRGGTATALTGHDGEVAALAFSPDGALVVSAGADGVVRAWGARDGSLRYALSGHIGGATALVFSPDGSTLLTADRARHVRAWDAWTGSLRRELIGHFAPVNSIDVSPDGRWLVSTSSLAAALWQWSATSPFTYLRGHASPVVRTASFSADGLRVVSAGDDGTVRVYRCEVCGDVDDLMALARSRLAAARVTR